MAEGRMKILTLEINTERKAKILEKISKRMDGGEKTFITTPNPEFFYASFWNYKFEKVINSADFNLPDGIGVIWASYFLSIPFLFKGYYPRVIEGFFVLLFTAMEILFVPKKVYKYFKEKITGAEFFWDLLSMTEKKRLRVYFLGGRGDIPEIVSKKVLARFPGIEVAGFSNSGPEDDSLAASINNSKADVLFVAFGHVKQETWIYQNLQKLNIKVAMGVGGTFDYVSGAKSQPPQFIRSIGLEWLYRLFTQPERIGRIWNATYGFMRGVLRHKVFSQMPYRQNVVGVIINRENKVFLGNRTYEGPHMTDSTPVPGEQDHWQFPQGGVDQNENADVAVLREIWEETGIDQRSLRVIKKSSVTNQYTWSHGRRELWFNKLKYKGQFQNVYFVRFEGENKDIDLNKFHHPEFTSYKWVSPKDLVNEISEYRRPVAERILPELLEITNNGN